MEWRDIKGYEGFYQVSDTGLVKSVKRTLVFSDGRVRTYEERMIPIKEWFKNGRGYFMVSLTKHHKTKGFSVHRLVAEAFIANPNNYPQVNHKDKNRGNNKSDNLEWCSGSYNSRYSSSVRVVQYNTNWEYIKEWETIIDAASALNIPSPNIIKCCKKKVRTAGGFIWCYSTDKSMNNEINMTLEERQKIRAYSRRHYYKDIEKSRAKARELYHRCKQTT